MDVRKLNAIVSKPGGTAGKSSRNYKMTIPSAWAKELGITEDDKLLDVSFDGKEIIIKKISKEEIEMELKNVENNMKLTLDAQFEVEQAFENGSYDLEERKELTRVIKTLEKIYVKYQDKQEKLLKFK